jgi:HKD family nuclease
MPALNAEARSSTGVSTQLDAVAGGRETPGDVPAAQLAALRTDALDVDERGRLLMEVTLLHQRLGKGGMDERIVRHLGSGKYSSLRVLMAFAKGTGVGLLGVALGDFIQAGGAVEIIVGLDMDGTSPDALESLVGLGADVFVFGVKGDRTFHPKVMIFDTDPADEFVVIVGSNNWTPGGLDSNFEVALEIAARRSASTAAGELGTEVEKLWRTYRRPYCRVAGGNLTRRPPQIRT